MIWSYIGTILSMGANFIMLPFLIYFIDSSMLGLWYVFVSVGTITSLFDFGFSVTFARNITYCWSGAQNLKPEGVEFSQNTDPDFYMMKQVLSTCKRIYALISGVALLLMLTIGTAYVFHIANELIGFTVCSAWIIYCTAAFLNLYFGYYNSFLIGVGAVARANKNVILSKIIQILLTIILLFWGLGIIGASIAYFAYGLIYRQLGKHYFYKYKDIGKKLNNVKEAVTKEQQLKMFSVVWHNAWRDGVILICNYLCNQASTIICSLYLPLSETGVYSIGVQIAAAIAQISGTLYNAYQPELQSSYVSADKEKMRKTMALIVTSYVYLFAVMLLLTCTIGLPMLRIIKPEAVISVKVLLGLALYQFIMKLRNCYTSYFSCTNRIIYMRGFIVSAIICIALSAIALGPLHFGVWGLICAQIISQLIYNAWKWPLKANKELGLNVRSTIVIGTQRISNMVLSKLRISKRI